MLILTLFISAAEVLLNHKNMVFVPASEKDDKDYINLIKIINDLTGYEINPIKVTDYNAAPSQWEQMGTNSMVW